MFSILSRAFQVAAICAKTPASKRRKPGRWTLSSDDAYESEKRGGPDRIDLILVPPRELVERNELNAVARADGVRGVARQPRSLLPSASARGWRVPTRGSNEAGFASRAWFAAGNVKKSPAGAGLFTRGLDFNFSRKPGCGV